MNFIFVFRFTFWVPKCIFYIFTFSLGFTKLLWWCVNKIMTPLCWVRHFVHFLRVPTMSSYVLFNIISCFCFLLFRKTKLVVLKFEYKNINPDRSGGQNQYNYWKMHNIVLRGGGRLYISISPLVAICLFCWAICSLLNNGCKNNENLLATWVMILIEQLVKSNRNSTFWISKLKTIPQNYIAWEVKHLK